MSQGPFEGAPRLTVPESLKADYWQFVVLIYLPWHLPLDASC